MEDNQRVFICTACGAEVIATKFASQKTIKCQKCKDSKAPINPEIVAQALAKNPQKSRHTAKIQGDTKECPCIQCGKMVTVTKFATPSKVLCPECKGAVPKDGELAPRLKPNIGKLDRDKIIPMEEYELNDGIIANRRLREVPCPSCGKQYMKPVMIVDWSQFGMVIQYQCQSCLTTAIISEQARQKIQTHTSAKQFDYTGRQIEELGLSWRDSSRMANSLCTLIQICKDHNIDIDEELKDFHDSIPPYRYLNDRPVPSGFKIPEEDVWISTIQQAIDQLGEDNADLAGIANKLKGLLKGEKNV